jgi:glycosyltransferase involved in cell wall biosynthesis
MLPRISVVTPSFQHAAFIESTIQSVLSQGYPNLEYIVVDGGSADGTADILARYDDRLTHWCSEPDGGQYDAINKGFARATGDVFMWLNSDDMLLPRALFVIGEAFATLPEVEWMSTLKPGEWDANGNFIGVITAPGFSRQAFLDGYYLPGTRRCGMFIQQESTAFRRELWIRAGAKVPASRLAGDFALWCELYKHSDLFGIDYPIAGFRRLAGQRSADISGYLSEASAALSACRSTLGWSEPRAAQLQYSRIISLPKVGPLLERRVGYRARTIVNRDSEKPGAGWFVKDHRFLPR